MGVRLVVECSVYQYKESICPNGSEIWLKCLIEGNKRNINDETGSRFTKRVKEKHSQGPNSKQIQQNGQRKALSRPEQQANSTKR